MSPRRCALNTNSLLIGDSWVSASSNRTYEVINPYNGDVVSVLSDASAEDAVRAIDEAEKAFTIWSRTPAHQRFEVMLKAASKAQERAEDIAQIISSETGKSLVEARGEAGRAGEIIRLAAFEGSQLYGDSLPLDANKGTGFDKLGFTLRQPAGIVVAISPFNYPSLLVLHKIAPALAVGNSVILKPAKAASMTAMAIAQCFLDAGMPTGVLNLVTGSGDPVGSTLVSDQRVRKVSFTGSTGVGAKIASMAGVKKVSLELGASSPTVIMSDADIERAAHAVSLGGYINAGQVCISVQRVIVEKSIEADFLDALEPLVRSISVGDPKAEQTKVGTLINEKEAIRVEQAIKQAAADGAHIRLGGERDGSMISPAIVTSVNPDADFAQTELFGPAVSVSTASSDAHAIELANSTRYGLGSGVFTNNMDTAIRATREIESGIVHINWTPLWRADLMPYGGMKQSGVGKEGVRSAVNEMTEEKTVIFHGQPW